MKVMLLNSDDIESTPIDFQFEKPPKLGDSITINGKEAWINSIGQQVKYLPKGCSGWMGQYTFNRKYYFK